MVGKQAASSNVIAKIDNTALTDFISGLFWNQNFAVRPDKKGPQAGLFNHTLLVINDVRATLLPSYFRHSSQFCSLLCNYFPETSVR